MNCTDARSATDVSKIKVEENGRAAIFVNEERAMFHKVKVDGGLVQNQLCADYVVAKTGVGSVVVELKGTDVEHAVQQIGATVELVRRCAAPGSCRAKAVANLPVAGLIICSKYPKADTSFQKKQKLFVAKYKIPLHCVSGKGEFKIEKVLTFAGPK